MQGAQSSVHAEPLCILEPDGTCDLQPATSVRLRSPGTKVSLWGACKVLTSIWGCCDCLSHEVSRWSFITEDDTCSRLCSLHQVNAFPSSTNTIQVVNEGSMFIEYDARPECVAVQSILFPQP